MDVLHSAFGGASFDAVAWVNEALASSQPSSDVGAAAEALNAALSTSLVRLQLLSQECSDRADTNMTRVLSAMPRARRELAGMSADVPQLHALLEEVSNPAASPSTDAPITLQLQQQSRGRVAAAPSTGGSGGSHIAELEELDRAKSRLDAVRAMLQQAAAWDRLSRETDAVFESRVVGRMAEHLAALESTAASLVNLPGGDTRAVSLVEMRRSFEAVVAPLISDALSRHDVAGMRQLAAVHESLGQGLFVVDAVAASSALPMLEAWHGATAASSSDRSTSAAAGGGVSLSISRDLLAQYYSAGTGTPGAQLAWVSAFYEGVSRVVAAEASASRSYFESPATSPADTAAALSSPGDVAVTTPRALQALVRIVLLCVGGGSLGQGTGAGGGMRDRSEVISSALRLAAPLDAAALSLSMQASIVGPKRTILNTVTPADEAARLAALLSPLTLPALEDFRSKIDAAAASVAGAAARGSSSSGGGGWGASSHSADDAVLGLARGGALACALRLHSAAAAAATRIADTLYRMTTADAAEATPSSSDAAPASVDERQRQLHACLVASVVAVSEALSAPYSWYHVQFGVLLREAAMDAFWEASPPSLRTSGALPSLPLPSASMARGYSGGTPLSLASLPLRPDGDRGGGAGAQFSLAVSGLAGLEAGIPVLLQALSTSVGVCDGLTLSSEVKATADAVDACLVEVAQRAYGSISAASTAAAGALQLSSSTSSSGEGASRAAAAVPAAVEQTRSGAGDKRGGGGGDWLDEDASASSGSRSSNRLRDASPSSFSSGGGVLASGVAGGGALLRDVFSSAFRGVSVAVSAHLAALLLATQIGEALALRYGLLTSIAAHASGQSQQQQQAQSHAQSMQSIAAAPSPPPGILVPLDSAPSLDLRLWGVCEAMTSNPRRRAAMEALLVASSPGGGSSSANKSAAAAPRRSVALTGDAAAVARYASVLLPSGSADVEALLGCAYRAAFEALMAPIASAAAGVRALTNWAAAAAPHQPQQAVGSAAAAAAAAAAAHDDDMTSAASLYSLQPLPYASVIGEALLQLVQLCAPSAHPLVKASSSAADLLHRQQGLSMIPCVIAGPAPAFLCALEGASGHVTHTSSRTSTSTSGTSSASSRDHVSTDATASEAAATARVPLELLIATHAAAAAAHLPGVWTQEADAARTACGLQTTPPASSSAATAVAIAGDGSSTSTSSDENAANVQSRTQALRAVADRFGGARMRAWVRASLVHRSNTGSSGSVPIGDYEHDAIHAPLPHDVIAVLAGDVATDEATLWLHALAGGTCALLLGEYTRIPRLDAAGARQLTADVEYLSTVLSAVGVSLDPLLSQFVGAVSATLTSLRAGAGGGTAAVAPLSRLVARMRGV